MSLAPRGAGALSGRAERALPDGRRLRRVALSLSVLLLSGAAHAAGLHRVERLLTELPAKHDTLRVLATVLQGQRGDPCFETVKTVRVVGRRAETQLVDSLPPFWRDSRGVLQSGVEVDAAPVAWGRRQGVVLHRWYVNYAPTRAQNPECRYLALRGHRLVPVSAWCNALGRPVAGGRVLVEKSFGWFTALVPVRLRGGTRDGGLAPQPDRDRSTGLAELEIGGEGIGAEPHARGAGPPKPLRLYRGPVGEEGDSVVVGPTTTIVLGRAYAEVGIVSAPRDWDHLPAWEVAEVVVTLKRLAVVVGGRRGFVEERDFPALGLETEEE